MNMHVGGGDEYFEYLAQRAQADENAGFQASYLPPFLFDFQGALVEWAVRKGRSAIFADCGLGKTAMQLVWAQNVVEKCNRPVLIVAPLAVTAQTMAEAHKFGLTATVSRDGKVPGGIVITNYERLHYFSPGDFAGAVCDESSILKSFDGTRRQEITDFMRKMEFRLLCTATAAPNEYIELGTSSEALGYLGHMDMLSRFFKNDQGNSIKAHVIRQRGKSFAQLDDNAKWRFKGHAEEPFWKWVCSWARSIRRPSDLGFSDERFVLPPLVERQILVESSALPEGKLFALPAVGLSEQREERRRTISDRCEQAASLVSGADPAIVWCHLNDEGNLLERLIPDCVQVSGADEDEAKEEKFAAFLRGDARVLVTKGRIGGWGLNFQHCAHVVTFPSHSFEEYYQCVRRCWRFGQTRSVHVDVVTTEGEKNILQNLQRKSHAADKMFESLVRHMQDATNIERSLHFTKQEELPPWL